MHWRYLGRISSAMMINLGTRMGRRTIVCNDKNLPVEIGHATHRDQSLHDPPDRDGSWIPVRQKMAALSLDLL